MPKRTLISLCVSSILLTSLAHADTPTWVVDNTKNAEGIVTPSTEKDPLTVTLSKVVVSGVLKENLEIAESAASIAHFGVQEVDRLNATSLSDLFAYEPGITIDQSKTGGLRDIRIRGVGEERVLVMVDGAPLPATYDFGPYMSTSRNYFDLDAMKSVDLIKGPMSTLYGSSALAGGIFMQTKDPVDFIKVGNRFGGEAKIGYRSASNETLLSGTVANQFTDKLSAFARLTYTKADEVKNHYGKASSDSTLGNARKTPNPSDADNYNFLSKVVFEPNENHRISATYEQFKETLNVEPLTTMSTFQDALEASKKPSASPYPAVFKINAHTKNVTKRHQFALRHDFNAETTLFDRGFWNVYYQDNKATQSVNEKRANVISGSPVIPITDRERLSTFSNKSFGFGAEFSKGIAQSSSIFHNLTYGVNYRHNKVKSIQEGATWNQAGINSDKNFPSKAFPDSKIREMGAFLQDRITFYDGQFEVIAGIRYDHYKLTPKQEAGFINSEGVSTATGISKGHFSKRLALLWHPSEKHTFFLNYSEGFRAPSFSAVNTGFSNAAGGYIVKSNANLKPETSKSYELGWNYIDASKSLSLVGFYTSYDNFIDEQQLVGYTPSKLMIFQAINRDKSEIYGIEAKAHIDLFTIQGGSGVIGLNGSLAYAKGKEKSSKDPINSVEPLTAVIGVDYTYLDQFYLSTRVKAVQAKKQDDIYNAPGARGNTITRSAGYATVDVIAEYKPTRDITINAGLYNILDKKYVTWGNRMTTSSPEALPRATNPGFNAALSIKYEF